MARHRSKRIGTSDLNMYGVAGYPTPGHQYDVVECDENGEPLSGTIGTVGFTSLSRDNVLRTLRKLNFIKSGTRDSDVVLEHKGNAYLTVYVKGVRLYHMNNLRRSYTAEQLAHFHRR
jgi:hypothetical protein